MNQKGMELVGGTIRWMMMSIIAASAVLFLFALLLWTTGLPERLESLYALVSCGAGCALCGLGGGRMMGKRGLLWGMAYGLLFLLLFFTALYGITGGMAFPSLFRPGLAFCIALSGLAGALGVNLRKE